MVDVEDLQETSIPKDRTEILKWNGWGYNDTQFELGNVVWVMSFCTLLIVMIFQKQSLEWKKQNIIFLTTGLLWLTVAPYLHFYKCSLIRSISFINAGEDGKGTLTGDRYELSGKTLPAMKDWMVKQFDIDLSKTTTAQPQMNDVPAPILNQPFLDAIKG